ncbi:MAG TPA: UDP-N-acetylglucosamine 2-epimerase (non-hydrolyzing) [Firmicutes bacterium]|nr:UDP-N-acetylglucosamine 2-epimerase (non-hydrolyzing) [Bacillota bacterium]
MAKIKIMSVFGTRPEAIKMAPVVKALAAEPEFDSKVVVTAQHREMLDQVLDLFSIRPDYDLDVMAAGQSLTQITCRILIRLDEVLATESPDMVLVHGDTSTTFAAALAAFYRQVSVGHVEAGLRTGVKYFPYPEEINRCLTGVLADLHFAPTDLARNNLIKEGVPSKCIQITGNTAIDALFLTVDESYQFCHPTLRAWDWDRYRILVVEAHRRENWGQPLENVCRAVAELTAQHRDLAVIFPVHLNPKVQEPVRRILGDCPRVHLLDPLGYADFANLMARSHMILSDSGGIQEEAPSLGRPVLVLRNVTERPEAVAAGTVKVVGTDKEKVVSVTKELLTNEQAYGCMAQAANPYGDGQAARRIVSGLKYHFGLTNELPLEW